MTGALADFGEHQVLVLAGVFVACFILEDAATVAAAQLAAQGVIDPMLGIAVLCIGTGSGDIGLHLAGRWARRHPWVDRQCGRPAITHAADWLARRSWSALFLARFAPGLRLPTYLASGLLNLPSSECAIVIVTATILWTPFLFLLSMMGWTALAKAGIGLSLTVSLVALSLFCRSRFRKYR